MITIPAVQATMKGERDAGDFGFGYAGPSDEGKMDDMKLKELLHGRLAMCAVGGIATQSVLSGHGFPYV